METCIALLRGINVGGANKLPMRDLQEILTECGADSPKTLIQSGNCVFGLEKTDIAAFPESLASAIEAHSGFKLHIMLLTLADLNTCIAGAPFKPEEPKHLHVWFTDEKPKSPDTDLLEGLKSPAERFELKGKCFYLHAPDGIGRSKLAAKVEKALGVAATARNLNTLQKLAALAKS